MRARDLDLGANGFFGSIRPPDAAEDVHARPSRVDASGDAALSVRVRVAFCTGRGFHRSKIADGLGFRYGRLDRGAIKYLQGAHLRFDNSSRTMSGWPAITVK